MTRMIDGAAPAALEEQAAAWCFRLADRPLTDAERDEYEAWLAADRRHRDALEEMVSVWRWTDAIAGMPGFLSLRAKALSTMESAREQNEVAVRRWRLFDYRSLAAAAALALMVAGNMWFFADRPDIYTTDVGERRMVHLDDGSSVSLDASSEIAVSYSQDRRAIVLEQGRARFDVAKDSLRPFTVTAGERTVVAVGTEFSVELLHDEMHVLLYEGEVEVVAGEDVRDLAAPAKAERQVDELQPGQELVATLSTGAARIALAEVDRSLSWEEGRLDFVNEPLARAVERMNRYSTTPIAIADATVGRHQIDGVFDAGDTRTFVKGVTALYPVAAVQKDGKITLTVAPKTIAKENGAQR